MTFASITYIIFFTLIGLLLAISNISYVKKICDKHLCMIRHVILLLASYIFYGWWDWRFSFLLLFVTIIAYGAGLYSDKKKVVVFAIVIELCVLCIFKYFNFFMESLYKLFDISSSEITKILLPVGISFYIFQAISYIVDVHQGKVNIENNFINVALYISFFPQLVAGPIIKADCFLPQLKEDRNISFSNVQIGLQIFVFGLFKKIVLADNLSVYVDEVFKQPMAFSTGTIILAVISYAMQIYFDFSGYSDMAIGSAKCLGYDFSRNFNLPYISKNVSEFWKRWHISLSAWLMSYLYIPLGGNRRGIRRTYLNLMITMILGGLWHGSNWTFVIWGCLHGVALCFHKFIARKCEWMTKWCSPVKNVVCIAGTNIFVCLCWVFFRADSVEVAKTIIMRIFFFSKGITHIYSWTFISLALMVICYLNAYLHDKTEDFCSGYYKILDLNKISSLIILFVMIGLTIGLAYTNSNPFIYFQF